MIDEQLAAIRARCEAATPGPWEPGTQSPYTLRFSIHQSAEARKVNPLGWQRACICREARMMDAAFIAHARQDVITLLADVEQLRATLRMVEGVNDGLGGSDCPWCHGKLSGLFPTGHRDNCKRSLALGLAS